MRGYGVGACRAQERAAEGIQFDAPFVIRCRAGSGDACLCTVLVEYFAELCGEQ